MKMIRLLMAVCIVNVTQLAVADAPAAAARCVACHGANGVSASAEWPNLAGQNRGYLASQIRAFRDGTRANPVMAPFVADLSEQDIADLAAYYAAQAPVVSGGGDDSLVETGRNLSAPCKACHGMDGNPATDDWPSMNGQHAAYLEKQLVMFKSGARDNGHMAAAVAPLGEAQFKALAAFYSRQAR